MFNYETIGTILDYIIWAISGISWEEFSGNSLDKSKVLIPPWRVFCYTSTYNSMGVDPLETLAGCWDDVHGHFLMINSLLTITRIYFLRSSSNIETIASVTQEIIEENVSSV